MNARSVKSFSIFYARTARVRGWLVLLLVAALLAVPAAAAKKKKKKLSDPEELFNPLLGIEYSHWLVGPIAEIASEEEIEEYLALVTDEDAASLIDAFWLGRAEGYGFFDKKPHQIFEERATEADKRFSEGALPGRSTDRGMIWIVYGEPEDVEYEIPRDTKIPTLEVWTYSKDAEAGLGGEKPKRAYRFVEIDGSKVFYSGQKFRLDPVQRERDARRSGG